MSSEKPKKEPVKWYLSPIAIFAAVIVAGPFAIPLVWASPSFTRRQRIFTTIIIILFTLWMLKSVADLCVIVVKEWQDLQGALR